MRSLELELVGNGHQWYSPRYVHAYLMQDAYRMQQHVWIRVSERSELTPCNIINSLGSTVLSIPLLNFLQKFLNQMKKLISNVNITSKGCHTIVIFIIVMNLNNVMCTCMMLTNYFNV